MKTEAAKTSNVKSLAKRRLFATTAMTVAGLLATTAANAAPGEFETPTGFSLQSGSATQTLGGAHNENLTIDQSTDRSVINWSTFNIGSGASTTFNQPNAGSLTVNRVTGGTDPSQIYGTLKSNGQIMILDQNGVFFDGKATINVGGIIASTGSLDGTNQALLMNGKPFSLDVANNGSKILNYATINVADAGLLAFVAPYVANNGVINAKMGKVTLASGKKVTVDLTGDDLILLDASDKLEKAYVENSGDINAAGGKITMTASAAGDAVNSVVNMKGVAKADSFTSKGGKIVLSSSGTVNVSGTATATGSTGGGSVTVSAENSCVAADAYISADATKTGNGGTVTIFGNNVAIINGSLSAKGGEESGDGGLIETSGLNYLNTDGLKISTAAANGAMGTWLIDPLDVKIIGGKGDGHDNSGAAGAGTSGGWQNLGTGNSGSVPYTEDASNAGYTIYESEIEAQSATTNITIQALRNISTEAGPTSGGNALDNVVTLAAGSSLTIQTENKKTSDASDNSGTIDLSKLGFAVSGTGNITVTGSTQTGGTSGTGSIKVGNLTADKGTISLSTDQGTVQSVSGTTIRTTGITTGVDAVNIAAGSNIQLLGNVTALNGAVTLNSTGAGGVTVTGIISTGGKNLTITNTSGPTSLQGAISTGAGDVSVTSASGDIILTGAGSISTSTGETDLTANSGSVMADGAITATGAGAVKLTAEDDVSVNGALTSHGGAVTLAAGTNDSSDDVAVNAAVSTGGGAFTATARGSIYSNALGSIATSNGKASLTAGTSMTLNSDITTGTGAISLGASGTIGTKALTSTSNDIDVTTGGDVTLGGTVGTGGAGHVNVKTTSGNVTTAALTSGTGFITIEGEDDVTTGGAITSTGGAVTLKAGTNDSTDDVAVNGAVSTGGGSFTATARGAIGSNASGSIGTSGGTVGLTAGTTLALNADITSGAGSITLGASSTVGTKALTSTSNNIDITAGGDVTLGGTVGTGGAGHVNVKTTSGNITAAALNANTGFVKLDAEDSVITNGAITTHGAVTLLSGTNDASDAVTVNEAVATNGGDFTAIAKGAVSTGASGSISTGGGKAALTSTDAGIFLDNDVVTNGGTATFKAATTFTTDDTDAAGGNLDQVLTSGGAVSITANDIAFSNTGSLAAGETVIDAGAGSVTVDRATNGAINLGAHHAAGMDFSAAEVAAIKAGTLTVGGANTSAMTVDGVSTTAGIAGATHLVVGKEDGDVNDLTFYGTDSFNGLTGDVNDDVHFTNGANVASFGDVTFSTDNNVGSIGDFNMDATSTLDSKGHNVTVNTLGVNITGSSTKINAGGGNITFNNSHVFTASANSLNTSGLGKITLNQWNGGSINNAVAALNNTGTGLNTVNIGSGTYSENIAADQANLLLKGASGATIKGTITVSAANVTIDPITFDGTNTLNYGIVASGAGADGLVVDGNTFRNFKAAAISIDANSNKSATIKGNTFEGSSKVGVLSNSLAGGFTLNVENSNVFGSNGSKLTNAVKLGTVNNATVNLKGTSGTAYTSGNGYLFDGLVSNGSSINVTGGTLSAGLDGVTFNGDINHSTVSITVANIAGGSAGVDFEGQILNGSTVGISSSTITGGGTDGVFFGKDIGGASKVTISGNSITGHNEGIDVETVTGSTLKITNNTKIKGTTGDGVQFDGAVSGGSTVEVSGNTDISAAKNGVSFNGVTGSTAKVSGNTIVAGTNGIYAKAAKALQVLTNTISGFGSGTGVFLDTGSDNADVFGNTITGNNNGTGVKVAGSANVEIGKEGASNRNTLTKVDTGIRFSGADGSIVNNAITVGSDGIVADGANGLDVYNNDITGKNSSTGTGVKISNSSNVNVGDQDVYTTKFSLHYPFIITTKTADRDNRINSFSTGVSITGGDLNNVVNNTIGNVHNGVKLSGSTNADVLDNAITGNSTIGINVTSGSTGAHVSGNSVTHFDTGINVDHSSGVTVDGNDLSEVKDGIVGYHADGLRVKNNDISGNGNTGTGIKVTRSDDVVIGGWDLTTLLGAPLLEGNDIGGFHDGISADDVSHLKIEGNNVDGTKSTGTGIKVSDSYGAQIGGSDSWLGQLLGNFVKGFTTGISSSGSDHASITQNRVEDSKLDGISVLDSDQVDVTGNHVTDAGRDGIKVDGSKHVTISWNEAKNSGDDGIDVVGNYGHSRSDDDIVITHNDIDGAGDNGIQATNVWDLDITHNDVDGAKGNGIQVLGSDDVRITSNGVSRSSEDGVHVDDTKHVTISWNDINHSKDDGIDVGGSYNGRSRSDDDIIISHNDIDNSGDNGIQVATAWDVEISHNKVDDSGRNGVEVTDSKDVGITGNHVTDSDNDGIYVDPSSDITISWNGVFGSGHDGVFASDINGLTIAHNLIGFSGDDGVDVRGSCDVDVSKNFIFGSRDNGIQIDRSHGMSIAGNNISFFGDAGIQVSNSGGVTIDDNSIHGHVESHTSQIKVLITAESTYLGTWVPNVEGTGGHYVGGYTIPAVYGYIDGPTTYTGTTGIRLWNGEDHFSGNSDVTVTGNNVRNNLIGLDAFGWDNGTIALEDNTFTDNHIGAQFASGEIDLTGDANTFVGGDTALLFQRALTDEGGSQKTLKTLSFGYHVPSELSLKNNTLGKTKFKGQSTWYVDLENGAFFAPGKPTIINGLDADWNGVKGGLMTSAQLAAIEAKIHDFVDVKTLGLIFPGFTPNINNNDIFNAVNGASFKGGKSTVIITGLPGTGGGKGPNFGNLPGLEPGAGDNGQNSAEGFANVEPGAGGNTLSVACWGNVGGSLTGTNVVTINLSGDQADILAASAGCTEGNL